MRMVWILNSEICVFVFFLFIFSACVFAFLCLGKYVCVALIIGWRMGVWHFVWKHWWQKIRQLATTVTTNLSDVQQQNVVKYQHSPISVPAAQALLKIDVVSRKLQANGSYHENFLNGSLGHYLAGLTSRMVECCLQYRLDLESFWIAECFVLK